MGGWGDVLPTPENGQGCWKDLNTETNAKETGNKRLKKKKSAQKEEEYIKAASEKRYYGKKTDAKRGKRKKMTHPNTNKDSGLEGKRKRSLEEKKKWSWQITMVMIMTIMKPETRTEGIQLRETGRDN